MKIDIFNTSNKYEIIYADPPWQYNDKMVMKGVHGPIRGAGAHYDTMTLEDIKSLPVKDIATPNCILFMWVTMPFLTKAEEVMNAWGFVYKTCGFCWIKKTKNNKIHCGMGHYTRGNAELCLIGTRGKKPKLLTRSMSQIVEAQIQHHSKKPDLIRDKIVELCGEHPRIELFARDHVMGWDCWGNDPGLSTIENDEGPG